MLHSCAVSFRIQTFHWLALGLVCLSVGTAHAADAPVGGATFDEKTDIAFPPSPAIVDVTKAPYHARGDGKTDDTVAIQRALSDVMGLHKVVYLPAGTYLVSKTLNWSKKMDEYIASQGYNDMSTLVAFSGSLTDEAGESVTEVSLNGRSDVGFPERAELDGYYYDHRSVRFDLRILARTFIAVAFRRGAH